MKKQQYTNAQLTLVQELCLMYGLMPDQISFEGNDITPIFDYEAVGCLSLKLTDIHTIACEISGRDDDGTSTAKCTVTLPDGRSRIAEESAAIGEKLGNGVVIETAREADGIAQNRAVRRGIRSVGVNLYKSHLQFKEKGEITSGTMKADPRQPIYAEIHIRAAELDLIVDGDKSKYEEHIAELYDGRTSAADLNDLELQGLLRSFRSLARLSKQAA